MARPVVVGASVLLAAFIASGVGLSSCIVTHSRCGEHQVSAGSDLHACVCEPGYVLNSNGYDCQACGDHEVVSEGKCVCDSGYTRANPDSACEMIDGSAAGDSCSADAPCSSPNPYCAIEEDEPFCTTSGCSTNDDCPSDWLCNKAGSESYCARPPTGWRKACTADSDCAGTEAPFCEIYRTSTCIVKDCASRPSVCPSQSRCCDLSAVIGNSICVSLGSLEDGKCVDGKEPVTQ